MFALVRLLLPAGMSLPWCHFMYKKYNVLTFVFFFYSLYEALCFFLEQYWRNVWQIKRAPFCYFVTKEGNDSCVFYLRQSAAADFTHCVHSFAAGEQLICLFLARLQRKVWQQGRETKHATQKPNCLQNADLKERFSQTKHCFECVVHCLCR